MSKVGNVRLDSNPHADLFRAVVTPTALCFIPLFAAMASLPNAFQLLFALE